MSMYYMCMCLSWLLSAAHVGRWMCTVEGEAAVLAPGKRRSRRRIKKGKLEESFPNYMQVSEFLVNHLEGF